MHQLLNKAKQNIIDKHIPEKDTVTVKLVFWATAATAECYNSSNTFKINYFDITLHTEPLN